MTCRSNIQQVVTDHVTSRLLVIFLKIIPSVVGAKIMWPGQCSPLELAFAVKLVIVCSEFYFDTKVYLSLDVRLLIDVWSCKLHIVRKAYHDPTSTSYIAKVHLLGLSRLQHFVPWANFWSWTGSSPFSIAVHNNTLHSRFH
jgi:hypothetical protein